MCNCTVDVSFEQENLYIELTTNMFPAKSIHKCGECGREIQVGEKYETFVGEASCHNERHIHRTCTDCLSLRENMFYDWVYGQLWEDFEFDVEDTDRNFAECLSKLTPRAREMAAEIIEKHWR